MLTLASVSVVGEGKEKKMMTRMYGGVVFLPLRNDEAVTCVLWHLKNTCVYLSCKIRILY